MNQHTAARWFIKIPAQPPRRKRLFRRAIPGTFIDAAFIHPDALEQLRSDRA